jgi:hypothetical protein
MIGKKQLPSGLLGIALDGPRVHVAQVRRTGDSFEVQQSFSFALSANPVNGDRQVLGQEIRQALRQHNIKENRCVVALPLRWVLSLQTKIPPIPEADIAEFLNLEAERNFPYDPDSLFVSADRSQLRSGEQFATIAGVQRDQTESLRGILEAARLKPLSFTLGLSAIQKMFVDPAMPSMILILNDDALEIGVAFSDGLLATRYIDNVLTEAGIDGDVIGRELRVTLGQLPAEVRGTIVNGRAFGPTDLSGRLRTELAPRLRSMGLEIDAQRPAALPAEASVTAFAVAGAFLAEKRPAFEFLPPKVSAWKQFAGKTSSRKLAWAAGILAGFFLLVMAAMLVQSWQLSNLQARWNAMAPRVTELEAMQQQIKKFRPWFDNSFRSLNILRKLTEAFPVDGVVTAKSLEVRDESQVTCSGVARDDRALFKMIDQLRSTKGVQDVKLPQIHGKSPMQFSFSFRFGEGGTGEH